MSADKYIIIEPTGGLCNRLRVIFDHLHRALRDNKALVVVWRKKQECGEHYLDYFHKIENVTFVENLQAGSHIDYRGCSGNPPNYAGLKLQKSLHDEISSVRQKLFGDFNYIAVHIRRTDHIQLAQSKDRYTDDLCFQKFVDHQPKYKVYLATDNAETQNLFLSLYPERVVVYQRIRPSSSLRQTSLKHSIMDLYLCISAIYFLGSGYSSFSDLITRFRQDDILRP